MNGKNSTGDRPHLRQIGRQLKNYRILELVGQGQFGKVFCASDRKTGQLVALKELSHRRLPTSQFLRELGSVLTLQHPNIVTCRALEQTATARYLVMDYCEGGTFRNLLEQPCSLSLGEGLQLMLPILAGLAHAHQQGIIHCDIKPENILLSLGFDIEFELQGKYVPIEGQKGVWLPRLSDFGIARRWVEPGTGRPSQESADAGIDTIGAPGYTAPEGFYGLYSPACDIYSVGILLFELLMGYRPFSGAPAQLMWAHMNQPLQLPPLLPEALRAIVQKALAKLPARRFAGAAQMAKAIEQAMDDPQVRLVRDRPLPFGASEQGSLGVLEMGRWRESPHPSEPPSPAGTKFTWHVSNREQLPAPVTALVGGHNYLYGALGTQVRIWAESGKMVFTVDFPEQVTDLVAVADGCLASTHRQLYWLPTERWQPQPLFAIEHEFRAAVDPAGRCLAVAGAGQLRFYSLPYLVASGGGNQTQVSPARSLSLPVRSLPQLIFLDQRHLLAVWSDPESKQPQTIFMAYTRRGSRVGSLRLPLVFDELIPAVTSGTQHTDVKTLHTTYVPTIFGIERHPSPAVLRLRLMPLQVKRMSLRGAGSGAPPYTPVCSAPAWGGCVLADADGEILLLDDQGQRRGYLQGPPAPLAIAPVGNTCLAVTTGGGAGSYLYFIDIDF